MTIRRPPKPLRASDKGTRRKAPNVAPARDPGPPTTAAAMGKNRVIQGKNRHAHEHIDMGQVSTGKSADGTGHEQGLNLVPIDVDAGIHDRSIVIVDPF